MTIMAAMVSHVKGNASLLAAFGDRIYPAVRPEPGADTDLLPALTLDMVAETELQALDARSGVFRKRIQLTVWSKEYDQAYSLRISLKGLFMYFKGTMGGAGGVEVLGIHHESSRDLEDPLTQTYGAAADLMVWHREES